MTRLIILLAPVFAMASNSLAENILQNGADITADVGPQHQSLNVRAERVNCLTSLHEL